MSAGVIAAPGIACDRSARSDQARVVRAGVVPAPGTACDRSARSDQARIVRVGVIAAQGTECDRSARSASDDARIVSAGEPTGEPPRVWTDGPARARPPGMCYPMAVMEDPLRVIYETVHGSRAYGLDTPESDEDLKGIGVGPRAWYFGYRVAPEQVELSPDHVRYELRKFFRLAAAANPTVLELLYTDPRDHRVTTPQGDELLAARDRFLSRRAEGSFAGYAISQLARIKTHRRWLLHPPSHAPARAEFGLPERSTIPRDQLGAVEAMIADGRVEEAALTPNFLAILDRERRYRSARKEWEQYQGWLKTRNPRRAALEAQHGYDTKHAMHLVRLLRMGHEIVTTGAVIVRRPDADELRSIRAGAWSYDQLIETAERLSAAVHQSAASSPLPAEPDEDALCALCDRIVAAALQ